jgi:hypothetical protein
LPTKIRRAKRQKIPHRDKEHIEAEYSSHILNTGHTYGTVTDAKDVVRTEKRKTLKCIRKIPHIKNQ